MDLINWFPGHMAKALKEIKERQSIVDCFIVLLDARVPLTSYNEDFDSISPNKPRLFVFSKSDYSNVDKLQKILPKFNNKNDKCVVVNLKKQSSKNKILKALDAILEEKRKKDKEKGLLKPRLRCFVIGMPNVGKSTLINLLSSSKKTKVANFAGTTRSLQWVNSGEIQLLDTPGILMPKIVNQNSALKLMANGLIKQEIINDKDFYYGITDLMNQYIPEKFAELGINYQDNEVGKYNELVIYARKHNILQTNNQPNIDKVLKIFRNKILNFINVIWD